MVNPYSPLPLPDAERAGTLWMLRFKKLPVVISCLIAAIAVLYGLGVIVYALVGTSWMSMPINLQRSLFAKVSIILLLSIVCTFVNLVAAFRWQKGHFWRASLYNFVALAVVIVPLTIIPWRLLQL